MIEGIENKLQMSSPHYAHVHVQEKKYLEWWLWRTYRNSYTSRSESCSKYMHTVFRSRCVAISVSSSKPPFWYKPLHLHSIHIFLAIFCTICACEIKEYISHHRRRGTWLQTLCNQMICDSQLHLENLKDMLKLMYMHKLSSVLQIKKNNQKIHFWI